jgi:hypothetical protein
LWGGELRSISCGYSVQSWEVTDENSSILDGNSVGWNDEGLTFTGTAWTLFEASLVTVPADNLAGVCSLAIGGGVDDTARMLARQRMFESAEFYVRAQINCTELVGGRACELLLYPDLPPLPAEHDHIEAHAFAAVACAAPPAVKALIAYCEAEASALLEANLPVVLAPVEAIIERGTLTGAEVDDVIARSNDQIGETGTAASRRLATHDGICLTIYIRSDGRL